MIMIYGKRETYSIDEAGHIGRPGIDMAPSKQWVLRGLTRLNNFGREVEFVAFERLDRLVGRDLLDKNGKPQWFMADLDHGTRRLMMEGVVRIYKAE